ncbi:glucose / Sorbosone dehydrogenase family protein [Collimonas arenae]|uniref:Glucose / Sorbosone dehydrogenase family protein n=1 Tax=Collimonas arenae TaxID=279058 RepID=A0A127PS40_9BURK|nr:PQQ-dependent sugar dehydrogenase [Collimonas arenae]AMP00539.1 glucose / Sorbosone dehydrogenase family protein [Collimonas arenae]AMP10419.1 glucose / Sorbosone dehydrogenase family protein [Collimonas arenae]
MRPALLLHKFLCIVFLLACGIASAKDSYQTSGSCDGFPRLDVKVAKGMCVGLVADHLGFARGVAAIGQDIYVLDMGGWTNKRGRLLRLNLKKDGKPEVLLSKLDMPNAIVATPDKRLLISMVGRIVRIDPAAKDIAGSMQDVIVNLPSTGRHPLSAMVLGADGSLYINVGSATDNCESQSGKADLPCPEIAETPPRASVLHANLASGQLPLDARAVQVHARGLRNSMALAISADGKLIAATNSRDNINVVDPKLSDAALPHDTLSWLVGGADYGWPYCFDMQRASPEYAGFDCSKKTAPSRLLPAHAAPLGMLIYNGKSMPALAGHLIIGYHGYRDTGHRLVSQALNATYQPVGEPQEIISGWHYRAGGHPMGAPVALATLDDGSIVITEDRNGTLLRLAPN